MLQKARYEQKNSSVNLKNYFQDDDDLSKVYLDFKIKLDKIKKKSFIVGVSGGPDSMALAALSKAYSFEKKNKFYFVHIDHNLRKNSFKEANRIKKKLKNFKINLIILSNKTKIKKNIQSNARKIRYEMLTNFCKKKKISTLLTAHHLEDQVETFFIRLSRGSGLKGLSSMKKITELEGKVRLHRPLLETKKKLLTKITKSVFGNYIKDPSNKNRKFLRTKIRDLEKPLQKSGINYDQIIRSINNLASSENIVDKYFRSVSKEITKKFKSEIKINFDKFKYLESEIKIRLINESIKKIKKNYYNPRSKKVINLIKNLEEKKFKKMTLGGCVISRKNGEISLKIEKLH